jgi:hypothetical protein
MKRLLVSVMLFVVLGSTYTVASAKKKTFAYPPAEVFEAALQSATEHHVVSYVDQNHWMFTFESGHSMSSWAGFKCNVVIESKDDGKSAEMVLNPQMKESGQKQAFSWGAGGRLADDMFHWTEEKLKTGQLGVKESVTKGNAGSPKGEESGKTVEATAFSEVSVKSTPDGAEITVDGKFSGNTPSVLKLPAGDHSFLVTAKGFQPWQRTVTLNSGANITVNATLESEAGQAQH